MFLGRRGSFSIDAFFALLLLLTASTMLLNAAQGGGQIANKNVATQEADLTAEKLAAAINTVYANDPSFELCIELPDNIRVINEDYVASYENYTISLDLNSREIFIADLEGVSSEVVRVPIIPQNIYDFDLGPENLSSSIRISWIDNVIMVRSVE